MEVHKIVILCFAVLATNVRENESHFFHKKMFKDCTCFPNDRYKPRVSELASEYGRFERKVVYLFKYHDSGSVSIFVPNQSKQEKFPDLSVGKMDKYGFPSLYNLLEIFNNSSGLSPSLVLPKPEKLGNQTVPKPSKPTEHEKQPPHDAKPIKEQIPSTIEPEKTADQQNLIPDTKPSHEPEHEEHFPYPPLPPPKPSHEPEHGEHLPNLPLPSPKPSHEPEHGDHLPYPPLPPPKPSHKPEHGEHFPNLPVPSPKPSHEPEHGDHLPYPPLPPPKPSHEPEHGEQLPNLPLPSPKPSHEPEHGDHLPYPPLPPPKPSHEHGEHLPYPPLPPPTPSHEHGEHLPYLPLPPPTPSHQHGEHLPYPPLPPPKPSHEHGEHLPYHPLPPPTPSHEHGEPLPYPPLSPPTPSHEHGEHLPHPPPPPPKPSHEPEHGEYLPYPPPPPPKPSHEPEHGEHLPYPPLPPPKPSPSILLLPENENENSKPDVSNLDTNPLHETKKNIHVNITTSEDTNLYPSNPMEPTILHEIVDVLKPSEDVNIGPAKQKDVQDQLEETVENDISQQPPKRPLQKSDDFNKIVEGLLNSKKDPQLLFPDASQLPNSPSFDMWLLEQLKSVDSDGLGVKLPNDVEVQTFKMYLWNLIVKYGFVLTESGDFMDASGRILKLTDLRLKRVMISDPAIYKHIMTSHKCIIPHDIPYLEAVFVGLVRPPRILGVIPLRMTLLPKCKGHQCTHKSQCNPTTGELSPLDINHAVKIHYSPTTERNLVMFPTKEESRSHSETPEVMTINLRPEDIETVFEEYLDEKTKEVKDEQSNDIVSSDDDDYDDVIHTKIVGGNAATSSGTPVNSRGRSGYNGYWYFAN